MKEAEVINADLFYMLAAGLYHAEGAHDVGLIKCTRPGYGAIDVALSGKVIDLENVVVLNDCRHEVLIVDVIDIGPNARLSIKWNKLFEMGNTKRQVVDIMDEHIGIA